MWRVWQMPNPETFKIPAIVDFLSYVFEVYDPAIVVDPYACNSTIANYRNDINPKTATKSHKSDYKFLEKLWREDGLEKKVDCVLLDPPYSEYQNNRHYNKYGSVEYEPADPTGCKRVIADTLLKDGGMVICFAWNSVGVSGIPNARHEHEGKFKKIATLTVAHGGAHPDTIVTVELKEPYDQTIATKLTEYKPRQEQPIISFLNGNPSDILTSDILYIDLFKEIGYPYCNNPGQPRRFAYSKLKDSLISKPIGTKVALLSWNSNGVGKGRGYKLLAVYILSHIPMDKFITIEEKV